MNRAECAEPFRCPICRSQIYNIVTVERSPGSFYQTAFFECGGCSVMFRDPGKFTRFEPWSAGTRHPSPDFRRGWPGAPTTAALVSVLRAWIRRGAPSRTRKRAAAISGNLPGMHLHSNRATVPEVKP